MLHFNSIKVDGDEQYSSLPSGLCQSRYTKYHKTLYSILLHNPINSPLAWYISPLSSSNFLPAGKPLSLWSALAWKAFHLPLFFFPSFFLRKFSASLEETYFFPNPTIPKVIATELTKSKYLVVFWSQSISNLCCSWGTTGPHILGGALPVPHALLLLRTRWQPQPTPTWTGNRKMSHWGS